MKRDLSILMFLLIAIMLFGCYRMRVSNGGGEKGLSRNINARDVVLSSGYKIDLVAKGFTFPTDITFDDNGSVYVLEAGYSYGEVWGPPQLIEVKDGSRKVIASGRKMARGPASPITMATSTLEKVEKQVVARSCAFQKVARSKRL